MRLTGRVPIPVDARIESMRASGPVFAMKRSCTACAAGVCSAHREQDHAVEKVQVGSLIDAYPVFDGWEFEADITDDETIARLRGGDLKMSLAHEEGPTFEMIRGQQSDSGFMG